MTTTLSWLGEQTYGLASRLGLPGIVPFLVILVVAVSVVLAYIGVACMFLIWWER